MLRFIFRVYNWLNRILTKLTHAIAITRWKNYYPGRFVGGRDFGFGHSFAVHFDSSASVVKLGAGVLFRDFCQIRSGNNGRLTIGDRVFFNNYCTINCLHEIVIGSDCLFGEGVRFYDHNHGYENLSMRIADQDYKTEAIKVGNNCWFGSGVIVLKGVHVGDNVIVGAGCVIHQSVPSNSIVLNKQELTIKNYRR
mgnify:CR=1 FL=1